MPQVWATVNPNLRKLRVPGAVASCPVRVVVQEGIKSVVQLPAVGEPVAVCVRSERVRAENTLPGVGQAVSVRVGESVARDKRVCAGA